MAASKGKKVRLDVALVERGLAPSRTKAQALIMAGSVEVAGQRVDKAGALVAADVPLTLRERERFVSRGGHKLESALEQLECAVTNRVCLDIGASTGGFTDCLLQRGAASVYAVDVGHGLLAASLRADPRVTVMERTNARHLERGHFDQPISLVVVDASFISIEKLLPAIAGVLDPGGHLLAMVKPQFEAGREAASRHKGVIRDPELRAAVIDGAVAAIVAGGFSVIGRCDSALPGPKGNVEHFVWAERALD